MTEPREDGIEDRRPIAAGSRCGRATPGRIPPDRPCMAAAFSRRPDEAGPLLRHGRQGTRDRSGSQRPGARPCARMRRSVASGQAVRRLTLDQEIEGSNPSSPANTMTCGVSRKDDHNILWRSRFPQARVKQERRSLKIRRTRIERETVVCAPDSSRLVRLTPRGISSVRQAGSGLLVPNRPRQTRKEAAIVEEIAFRSSARPSGVAIAHVWGSARNFAITLSPEATANGELGPQGGHPCQVGRIVELTSGQLPP